MFEAEKLVHRLRQNAVLFQDPFPYIWVPEFFEQQDYEKILKGVHDFDPTGKVNYESRAGTELYDPPETELFKSLKKSIGSPLFAETIFGYFGTQPFGKFDVTLNRDFYHKYYGPHLDYPPVRLSFQIYLPSDRSQESLGTVLGRKNEGQFHSTHQLKFLPNSGYAFISGVDTWHSLPVFDALEKPRYSLMYRWKDLGSAK